VLLKRNSIPRRNVHNAHYVHALGHVIQLTIGPAPKITADINAREVVVYGYVKRDVRAKGRIEIKKDGSVIRNLTTAQIMIEDGANFKGSIDIDKSPAKESDKNISARAASASAGAGSKSI
jgi:cytoskeletal protein CcmA (bactofilin family)